MPNRILPLLLSAATFALTATPLSATAAERYVVDPSHTEVGFSVTHMMINRVRGGFNEFEGVIRYDEDDPTKTSVEGEIATASIDTDHEKRDKHLRSDDFFWVEKYPTIRFESTAVRRQGDDLVLTGDLTMRGVTREVEIPFEITGTVTDPWGKTRLGFVGETTLDRKEFGINWNKTLDSGGVVVGDEITIELAGEAVRE